MQMSLEFLSESSVSLNALDLFDGCVCWRGLARLPCVTLIDRRYLVTGLGAAVDGKERLFVSSRRFLQQSLRISMWCTITRSVNVSIWPELTDFMLGVDAVGFERVVGVSIHSRMNIHL